MAKKTKILIIASAVANFILIFLFVSNFLRPSVSFLDKMLSFVKFPRFVGVKSVSTFKGFTKTEEELFADFEKRFGLIVYSDGTIAFVSKDPTTPINQQDIDYFKKNYLGEDYLQKDGTVCANYDIRPYVISGNDPMAINKPFLDLNDTSSVTLGDIKGVAGRSFNYDTDFVTAEVVSVDISGGAVELKFEFPDNFSMKGKTQMVTLNCSGAVVFDSTGSDKYSLIYGGEIISKLSPGRNIYGYCLSENCELFGGGLCTID